jgi:hypothetical protein
MAIDIDKNELAACRVGKDFISKHPTNKNKYEMHPLLKARVHLMKTVAH